MAKFIPSVFFSENNPNNLGFKFENEAFEHLKKCFKDNNDIIICHSLKTNNARNCPEVDFLIFDSANNKIINLEVKSVAVDGLGDRPIANYYNGQVDLNRQIYNAADSVMNSFNEAIRNHQLQIKNMPHSILYIKSHNVQNENKLPNCQSPAEYLLSNPFRRLSEKIVETLNNSIEPFRNNNLNISIHFENWLRRRTKQRLKKREQLLSDYNQIAQQHDQPNEFKLKGTGVTICTGYAGTGKTELIKLKIESLKDKNILVIAYNVKLIDALKAQLSQNKNITVSSIEEVKKNYTSPSDYIEIDYNQKPNESRDALRVRISKDSSKNLESAIKNATTLMNNQNNRKKYDYIFIDEGQDLLPREIEFLKIICPHNKTGWWINFDSSQQWKPETITFEQLNSCFDKHKPHVYNLKKALRIANPIRERIIVRNNFNIKDYTPNNFNYLTDSQYTELNCEQKKLNTLLNDQVKNFKEMKFEDNEIAVITEDSYDTFMQLNNNTVLLTNADFINTISPNIYFDSILRTKGLEFPVVIILMKKDSIDTPRCKQYRYIAETRSQLHITLIKVS